MHCDCAISRFSFPFFAFLFWQMGNNKLHLFLARQREEREGETSPDKVLHGDCVYSSLQGVCNNNGYDFIEPQKFPLVSLLPPPKRPRNNWAKWLHRFRFKTDQSEWGETLQKHSNCALWTCCCQQVQCTHCTEWEEGRENSSGSAGHCNANWTLNRANYCPPASVAVPPAACHRTTNCGRQCE